ncbi:MAG TPA: winged helix-turn-helix domain-containing protein [Terriglobia bacterium]|nr:winged helix-turn-helix domain-containing protein [Terriglobia bacterium]
MAESSRFRRILRFGPFQCDLVSGELRRNGAKIYLADQPLCILRMLLEHPGELITRQELQEKLWPGQEYGLFEDGLNTAVNKLRAALRDKAGKPRFIETIPRRGYRFIAPVEEDAPTPGSAVARGWTEKLISRRLPWLVALPVLVLAVTGSLMWVLAGGPKQAPPFQLSMRPLTANPQDIPVQSAVLSPDGRYLGYSDQQGIHLLLLDTGVIQDLASLASVERENGVWHFGGWYPNSSRFVAFLFVSGKPASSWSVPIDGSPAQKLADGFEGGGAVSPDGSHIAFLSGATRLGYGEIWLTDSHGESPREILTAGDLHGFGPRLAWSPASGRLAFEDVHREDSYTKQAVLRSCDLDGTHGTTIYSGRSVDDFAWTSPGRFIYLQGRQDAPVETHNLWEMHVDGRSGVPEGKPRRLTDWSGFSVRSLSATVDGKHLALVRANAHSSVFVGDLPNSASHLVNVRRLTADDYSNQPLAWTPDSREVIFVSDRTGTEGIYRHALDAATSQVVATWPGLSVDTLRNSPDGSSLIFDATSVKAPDQSPPAPGHPSSPLSALPQPGRTFFRVPVEGGTPEELFEVKGLADTFRCTSGPDGFCAYGARSEARRELVITAFNPMTGNGAELLRIPVDPNGDYNWSPSPDGSQFAVSRIEWNLNQIQLISLRTRETRAITVPKYFNLSSLDWAPDSRSLFVAAQNTARSTATLLRVGLGGSVAPLWRHYQMTPAWAIPSPDGRHIAIRAETSQANAWLIDGF